jgi:hypothetical protein
MSDNSRHPALREIPIGINASGSRFDQIVDPKKSVGHGVGGS